MARHEVILRLGNDRYGDKVCKDGSRKDTVCTDILAEDLRIPEDCMKLIAVFTTRKQADSYTIKLREYPLGAGFDTERAEVEEHWLLYVRAGVVLYKKYQLGYRFVHFEYES